MLRRENPLKSLSFVLKLFTALILLCAACSLTAAPVRKQSGKSAKTTVKSSKSKSAVKKVQEKNTDDAEEEGEAEKSEEAESSGAEEESASNGANPLEVPYLSLYYVQPVVSHLEPVKIRFYVTDWNQSEYRLGDNSHRFSVTAKWGVYEDQEKDTASVKNIPAGDHELSLGILAPGKYYLSVSAVDEHGRPSCELFHEFIVRDLEKAKLPEEKIWRVTEQDLVQYKISNKGDYGEFRFMDLGGKTWKEAKEILAKQAESIKAPAGKYVVLAAGIKFDPKSVEGVRGAHGTPLPEWIPDSWGWKSCKVIYAADYDKEAVEAESVQTGNGLNKLLGMAAGKKIRKVILPPGVYRVSNKTPILVPPRVTLDLNGATIKMNGCIGHSGCIVKIQDGQDTHVMNGIVEGDYFEHDYEHSEHNSEWVCGIGMDGDSRYSGFERILVRYITGYGVTNGMHDQFAKAIPVKGFMPGTVDRETGELIEEEVSKGLFVSEPMDITEFYFNGGYLAVSKYLGYQGIGADEWNIRCHFYDAEENYIRTVEGWQYRRMRIPPGSMTMRVTVYSKEDLPDGLLKVNLFRYPWNCSYENLFILSARCVGMAPAAMYNFKIANCTFCRSGENLAKCAFDAEDGWDMMQDVWIYRNKFMPNPLNELLTCAGHNFVIEDNEAKLHLWSRTNSYVCRGNTFASANYGCAKRRNRTLFPRIDGNTYLGRVQLGDRERPKKTAATPADGNAAKTTGDDAADDGKLQNGDTEAQELAENQALKKSGKKKNSETSSQEPPPLKKPDWFIVMKDADRAKNISCGKTGLLVGMKFKDMKVGQLNLLNGEVSDCELWLPGSRFIKCKLEKIKGHTDSTVDISECELKDFQSTIPRPEEVIIRDSTLEDVTYQYGYWMKPSKVTFINCKVKNKNKPLVYTPAYSIGEFKFINCTIDTGSSPVVEIYDLRKQETDKLPGEVVFRNCTVTSNADAVAIKGKTSENEKCIVFKTEGSTFERNLISQNIPFVWTVEATDKDGHRLRSSDFQKGKGKKSGSRKKR